jgi:hypothetical protein
MRYFTLMLICLAAGSCTFYDRSRLPSYPHPLYQDKSQDQGIYQDPQPGSDQDRREEENQRLKHGASDYRY